MYQKLIAFIVTIIIFSSTTHAQEVKDVSVKVDQKAQDPATKEQAAKADVYVSDKKAVDGKHHECKMGKSEDKACCKKDGKKSEMACDKNKDSKKSETACGKNKDGAKEEMSCCKNKAGKKAKKSAKSEKSE